MNAIDTEIIRYLQGVSLYPIPQKVLEQTAVRRQLETIRPVTQEVLLSAAFRLAKADLYVWLSAAPNVSLNDQDYSLGEQERSYLLRRAKSIYRELGEHSSADALEETKESKPAYGYKGSRL